MDTSIIIRDVEVRRSAKARNTTEDSISVQVVVDYNGMTLKRVLELATSSCIILGQRAWEGMTADEIREQVDGKTFHASSIGHKVKSRQEQIESITNAGIPESIAVACIDDPEKMAKLEEMLDSM